MENNKEEVTGKTYKVTIHYPNAQQVLGSVTEDEAQLIYEWYDKDDDFSSFSVNDPNKKIQFRRENILFISYEENHS